MAYLRNGLLDVERRQRGCCPAWLARDIDYMALISLLDELSIYCVIIILLNVGLQAFAKLIMNACKRALEQACSFRLFQHISLAIL